MYLVQAYRKQSGRSNTNEGILRDLISGRYMGAAEYEWGVLPKFYNWLEETDLQLKQATVQHKSNGKVTERTVYFAVKKEFEDSFIKSLNEHLDGGNIIQTKGYSGLFESFKPNPEKDTSYDLWCCIDEEVKNKFVARFSVLFSNQKELIRQVFIYLKTRQLYAKNNFKPEFYIGDKVRVFSNKDEFKVAGLLDNNKVVIKYHNQKLVLNERFVYPVFEEGDNSPIKEGLNKVFDSILF